MNRTLIAVMGGAFGFALAEIGCWYFSVRDEPVILLLIHLPMVLGFSIISYGVFARSKEQDEESSLEADSQLMNGWEAKHAADEAYKRRNADRFEGVGNKLHQLPRPYGEMYGIERTTFQLYCFIGQLFRFAFILGILYGLLTILLPDNVMNIRIADWTLKIIFGLIAAVPVVTGMAYWAGNIPEVLDTHNFGDNPFTVYWGIAAPLSLLWVASKVL